MSGFRSKKLMSNDRHGRGIEIVGLNIEQAEIPLRQSQIVDSLILTILLEHFDRILDIEPDYTAAREYLSRFTLQ
jgi:hypothetical protein